MPFDFQMIYAWAIFATFTFFWRDTKSMAGSKMEKGILVATNFLWQRNFSCLLPTAPSSIQRFTSCSSSFKHISLKNILLHLFYPKCLGKMYVSPNLVTGQNGGGGGEKNINSIAVSGSFNRGVGSIWLPNWQYIPNIKRTRKLHWSTNFIRGFQVWELLTSAWCQWAPRWGHPKIFPPASGPVRRCEDVWRKFRGKTPGSWKHPSCSMNFVFID